VNTIESLDEFREILSQFDPRGSAEITATLPSSPLLFFEKTACNGQSGIYGGFDGDNMTGLCIHLFF
jgi:hypothetical protein